MRPPIEIEFRDGAGPIDARYAADLVSRIKNGSIKRGCHSASDWYAVLSDRELERLGRMARDLEKQLGTDDKTVDVIMTVCLLACVEDPALSFPPTPTQDADRVSKLVFALRVHCEITIQIRQGIFEAMEPLRILDDHLPIRLTAVGRALLHAVKRGPRWG